MSITKKFTGKKAKIKMNIFFLIVLLLCLVLPLDGYNVTCNNTMVDSENTVLIDILAELKALRAQVDESNKELRSLRNETNVKLNDQATRLEKIAAEVVAQIHDANNIKVDALQNCSTYSIVCGSYVTAHFVLYQGLVFALSVAHTPCYTNHNIPSFIVTCDALDVSIWFGLPPRHISLLNISNSVVKASMGDSASAFGFSDSKPRSWHGTITGKLGYNFSGVHFTPSAYENEEELLFTGAQDKGMSGGGVLNGRGKLFICFLFLV
jgi:hypothetical protein